MDESDTYLHSAYQVSIIPTDLHHEETIIRAAQSLDCLNKTINSIFGRIDARLERNGAKVQQINERVMRAQAKINALVGSKKSIKIFAPARFPGSAVLGNIPATFPQVAQELMDPPPSTTELQQIRLRNRDEVPSEQESGSGLDSVSFHVRGEDQLEMPLVIERQLTNRTAGLGSLPATKSMPTLMRFNSNEFAYMGGRNGTKDLNAWKRTLPPQSSKRAANKPKPIESELLAPAPHSLAHGTTKLATPAGDLRYTPAALAAPAIDVPLDLPDLPGIANDLQYEPVEEQTPIAPSHQFIDLPDLPGLTEPDINMDVDITVQALAAQTHMARKVPQLSMNMPPSRLISAPPPPPPPTPAPPPPPPPPPPPQSTALKLPNDNVVKPLSPSVETPLNIPHSRAPPAADPRSELMAAIRNAGGALGGRLRSPAAAPVNMDVVDTQNTNSATRSRAGGPTSGGNLMADLHNKLMLRRKGISGNQNPAEQSGNPIMRQLSKLIESPMEKSNGSMSSDEGNSEEDDAWE
ncbi:hypothetical protein ACLKA7_012532 [Drosophila subpalustris]